MRLGAKLACRLLVVVAAMLALPAYASSALTPEVGPFPVGNLLNYANSDFEGQASFTAISNARISDASSGYLHSGSLRDKTRVAGTSVFRLQKGVGIGVNGGSTYTVSAYVKLSSRAGGQALTFGVDCYTSAGKLLGWSNTPSQGLVGETTWQYVEGQITVPSGCADVAGSPKLTLTGMAAGEVVNVDELTLRPYRAALVIGAHGNTADDGLSAYTATDWLDTNNTLGPLQSDKTFFGPSTPLPSSWASSSNNCYELEQALPSTSWPECVIAYKVQESEAQLQSFLAGLPAGQEVIMVWWQEPENATFSGCPGAATDNGSNFVCYFEQQSTNIRQAAAADGVTPQVLVAMDASTYSYDPTSDTDSQESLELDTAGAYQTGTSCSFIPPSSYVDLYLADHYEFNATTNMAAGPGERSDNWLDWLACVLPQNKPVGLGEYGLNPNDSNPAGTASTISADASYLAALPATTHEELAIWMLWDSTDGTTSYAIDDEPSAVSAWQAAETQNGGG